MRGTSLSDDKQADVIDAFNTTSRCLNDILNIINIYFDNRVSQIYPSEPFLDGDVPHSTSYGVYISQLVRFARASSYVADFNTPINC